MPLLTELITLDIKKLKYEIFVIFLLFLKMFNGQVNA